MTRRRRNAVEPPKSSEARWYLQALDIGQITPSVVERKIAEVKEALDDARYFDKEPAAIAKLEDRVRDLESVLVWDQAASVERGLAVAVAEKPAEPKRESAALPVRASAAAEPEITVPAKTHDGFPLDRDDREEIAKLLRLARDGRISRTSIVEAHREVEDKIRTEKDKEQLQTLRTRFVILDETLHLGKFALKNNLHKEREHNIQGKPRQRNSDEDVRRLERKAKAGDANALDALERQAISGRSPKARAAWLEALKGTERWDLRAKIVEAMARAIFVSAWTDAEEKAGRTYSGEELMVVAPETIPSAFDAAEDLAREFEEVNQKAFDTMYEGAAAMDGHDVDPTPDDFGYYTAMLSLGHGVSWEDDHPDHGFEIPHTDYSVTPAEYGEDEPELCAGCGGELEQPDDLGFDEGDYCTRCRPLHEPHS